MTIGSYGIPCSGCGVNLTQENIGGYRCYCQTCVDVIPPFPEAPAGTGFILTGTYPHFQWHEAIDKPAAPSKGFKDEDIPQ